MEDETQKFDDSPQALFVKNQLRRDYPDKNDEEIEAIWLEKLRRVIDQEGSDDNCQMCGS